MANPGMQSQPIPTLLIVEDGDEYLEFFERHLLGYRLVQAKNAAQTMALLKKHAVDLIVLDIRFDRIPREDLIGDVMELSRTRFGQDTDLTEAWRYLAEKQGFLVGQRLREQGIRLPFLFIESLPARQVENLNRLYGPVTVVPEFDPKSIHGAIVRALSSPP
ncbi:MAG: hypothetical protein KC561_14820 [Myxococcales bacterium]|nr:hypothetical protein [Myxococcales bacterium]